MTNRRSFLSLLGSLLALPFVPKVKPEVAMSALPLPIIHKDFKFSDRMILIKSKSKSFDNADMKEQMEVYVNGLQRYMKLEGCEVEILNQIQV